MINKYLNKAVFEASLGVLSGDGGPFGAIITDKNGNIISVGHNMVLATNDPTNHAEIVAIREACRKLKTFDLSNYIMYSSCEPCPMCLSAIIWANIKQVYYGADRKDAMQAGFKDNAIYEYLENNNNTILNKTKIENDKCIQIMKNYKGDKY